MAEATSPQELNTLEEYLEYFLSQGYKQVKDTDNGMSRSITFRKFEDGEAKEAIIKQIGSHISVKQTRNGIPI